MTGSPEGEPRGILNRKAGAPNYRLSRFMPTPDLEPFIEHYWGVAWDLRGKPPQTQEVLSHPSVHLVFERNNSAVFGVPTGKFTRKLEGQGQVFGIKFRPGGFYPFVKTPVSAFTGKIVGAERIFGPECRALEAQILTLGDESRMVEPVEAFLRGKLPGLDPNLGEIARIFERIMADRSIIKVEDLAERLGLKARTLQRLFNQYVGVSPKWVIQRYRLHEAAERLAAAANPVEDWAGLAQDLGYFDQAHFIKDFKALIGKTPAEYARQN
jgi:AraC-like DNA-binding protein